MVNEISGLHNKSKAAVYSVRKLMGPKKKKKKKKRKKKNNNNKKNSKNNNNNKNLDLYWTSCVAYANILRQLVKLATQSQQIYILNCATK